MTGKYVLVIDDENSVRKIICDNLKLSGIQVEAAASGDAGLGMINASNLPGVVITDMIMPGKSGLEVVSEIRRLHPAVKIIAISGGGRIKENDDMLEKAAKLGADMTLAKPLDLDELEQAVLKLLG
jgi:two-component system NtrC family response regulator